MSSDNNSSNRRRGQPSQFRNIRLTDEMVAMGISDIQVQAKNMIIRGPNGLLIMTKYDGDDLTRTQKMAESKLAELVGKPGGLPENFDPKSFAAKLSFALYNDLQDQFTEMQESMQQEQKRVNSILDEIKELKDQNSEITFAQWQDDLIRKYNNLKNIVDAKLPKIWPALEFGLSSLRILNIDDCTLPMIGILLGRPGSGKTVVIKLLSKWPYGYYTDNFSPKSWVSHTTSVSTEEELRTIDMLPKIKDRQFLTPELATLFNLKEDDLRVALSMITRIADGHGFYSDSGVYGHRGYEDVMFTWLGAVVDIPHHVYKVMSNLGPRLYLFRLPFRDIDTNDIYGSMTDAENFNIRYKAIEEALHDYLKWFEIGPTVLPRTPKSPHLRKVEWASERNDRNAIWCIANLALLLGHLRREGRAYSSDKLVIYDKDDSDESRENQYSYFTGEMEDVTRAATVLLNLARGHALITGRNYITMEDIPIVVKTVLSTARVDRVKAFIALLDSGNDGWISMKQLAQQLNVSRSTAYRYMTELKAIELVDLETTNDIEYTENNHIANVKIMRLKRDKFDWFLCDEFKELRNNFRPVDNRKYIQEEDPEKEAAEKAAAESDSKEFDPEQLAKVRAYDVSQAKIRADAAKMKREFDREIKGSGTDNDNDSPSPPSSPIG
jgi:predicted transcriptional regulator